MSEQPRPDYGLDAPGVVRNLLLFAALGFALWITTALGLWSGRLTVGPLGGLKLTFPLARIGLLVGLLNTGMALWMIWTSKVGKLRARERLLDRLAWTGSERVLDVGCGRGLMLVGAAKRLTTGKAVGIDIWQAEDLSGNRPEATLDNARREGVADRVEVETADMRQIPFPDASFDVVVSSVAIHNVYSAAGRAEVMRHIARVLKPGGVALLDDIRHGGEYAAGLAQNGCREIERLDSRLAGLLLTLLTFGSLRPVTLKARKA